MTEYIIFRMKLKNAERLLEAYDRIQHDQTILKQYFEEIREVVNRRRKIEEKENNQHKI